MRIKANKIKIIFSAIAVVMIVVAVFAFINLIEKSENKPVRQDSEIR